MTSRSVCTLGLVLVALLATGALSPAQPTASVADAVYTVVALDAPTGQMQILARNRLPSQTLSFARGINRLGQAVGRSGYMTGGDTRAVVWQSGGVDVIDPPPGGDYSAAFGINDAGVVVGTVNTGTATRGFRWSRDGGMQQLGTLPGDNGGEAFDINKAGQVVGASSGPQGIRAVLWRLDGRIQNLGTLPGGNVSKAAAINDLGQVVGASTSVGGNRAFLWTSSGGMQALGTLPGHTESEASGINNRGHVVGYSRGPHGTRAFLWTSTGGMRDLGTLPGGNFSRAYGINNLGGVVGTSTSSAGLRAFVWTPSSGMQDLNTTITGLATLLSEAHAINDAGQIAALTGAGEQPPTAGDNHDHEHIYRAFLLTPLGS